MVLDAIIIFLDFFVSSTVSSDHPQVSRSTGAFLAAIPRNIFPVFELCF